MRTEQDLRAAFALLDEHAPTECAGLLDEPHPKSRARRVLPLAGVVAAVAAVAIAVPLLVSGREAPNRSTPPAAAYEEPVTLRYMFTVGDVPGYTITPSLIQRDVQRADIDINVGTGNSTIATPGAIYVYRAGAFDPTPAKSGRPVEVNGHAGYFTKLTNFDGRPGSLDAVVWQYAPNAWAMVQVNFHDLAALQGKPVDALAEELKLARAVRTGHPGTLRVPFRFGYLPPGLVTEGAAPELNGASIYLGDGRPGDEGRGYLGSALSVRVYPGGDPNNGILCQRGEKFTVDGRSGCLAAFNRQTGGGGTAALSLNVKGGLVGVNVDTEHIGFYSDAQLKQIATTVQLATIGDPGTWFDATTVMRR
jgi:hypothetical protein